MQRRVWIGAAAVAAAFTPATITAEAEPTPMVETIVVHVSDYAQLDADELAAATRLAGGVYKRVGIRLVWRQGSGRIAPADGLRHVDVVILDAEMTARDGAEPNILAKAGRTTKRASVYYPRILARAARTSSDPTRVLALVLAHEIGHMLLPDHSHSRRGIMQPSWDGPVSTLPTFTAAQADTLRRLARAPATQLAK